MAEPLKESSEIDEDVESSSDEEQEPESPATPRGLGESSELGEPSPQLPQTVSGLRTLVRLKSVAVGLQPGAPAAVAKPAVRLDPTWQEEKECIVLLLKARMILRNIIEAQLKKERLEKGLLSVAEIQNLLKNQKEDLDSDWIAEIQELKRNIIAEVRKNHQLERDLNKVDKRIALLIKHRSNIKQLIEEATKKKTKAKKEGDQAFHLDAKQQEGYQHLFYLLQTDPQYLAKLVTLIQPDKMEGFLETVILTLFGDAFSPREEFLILSLFQLAIQQEMSVMKSVGDLLSVDSVVPKMIIAYNRRKQGHEYLKSVIAPILDSVTAIGDLNLELNPSTIYTAMINEQEIQSGTKSALSRDLAEDKVMENPEVKAILKARIEKCVHICNMFFDGICSSLNRLPYGIRWICKQINSIAKSKFNSTPDEIGKTIGYFVYYRFMNLAIVTPDSFDLVGKELSILARRNLVTIAKVLQNLFSLNQFQNQGGERWLLPMNEWISSKFPSVRKYFEELIQVTDPSEYLRVDKYNELTLKISPVIVISLAEISQTHKLIVENMSALKFKPKDDPLETIIKALGNAPDVSDEYDREIQLTLVNKFKEKIEEEISSSATLLAETKELIINVFRGIPQQDHKPDEFDDLMKILENAKAFGKSNNQPLLVTNVDKILGNLKKLEANKSIRSDDKHAKFLQEIALEVANRQEVREQQRKERMRLTLALRDLRKHGAYLNEQIASYNNYLKDVLHHYGPKDNKKAAKPIKFSYKDLAKQGVIVSSEVPKLGQKTTAFHIASETPGVFDIEAKMAGKTVDTIQLELDDLLEKSHSNIAVLKLENVTLDVNLTLHLLNRHFLKKIK